LFEAVVRGRKHRLAAHIMRHHQRALVIAVLQADDRIVARDLGQGGHELPRILRDAPLPVRIETSVDRYSHNIVYLLLRQPACLVSRK
jgi:hypothetical protein